MKCTKCQSCKVEPRVRVGAPVKVDDVSYWRHIFVCNDPNSTYYNKDVMQIDTDIFDNSKVISKEL